MSKLQQVEAVWLFETQCTFWWAGDGNVVFEFCGVSCSRCPSIISGQFIIHDLLADLTQLAHAACIISIHHHQHVGVGVVLELHAR